MDELTDELLESATAECVSTVPVFIVDTLPAASTMPPYLDHEPSASMFGRKFFSTISR